MSAGKLAAQVAHGSIAFLSNNIVGFNDGVMRVQVGQDVLNGWFFGTFTKIVCEARNKEHLLRVREIAQELNLLERRDFWLIRDNCLTELEPEDADGRTLTCIGFRPLDDDTCRRLSRKYQLYR